MQEVFSDSWGTDFASILKDLKTHEKLGTVIGTIVGENPLVIEVLDGEILINSSVHSVFILDSFSKGRVVIGSDLKKGDSVLVTPDETEHSFFIIGKIRKVGE